MSDETKQETADQTEYLVNCEDQPARGYAAGEIARMEAVEAVDRIGRLTLLVEASEARADHLRVMRRVVTVEENKNDVELLEPRENCPKCGDSLIVESEDPLEEYCINHPCDYYRAEGGPEGVIYE